MTRNRLILAATGGSAALLAGALIFQALGYAPCKLCLWQRYPHGLAIGVGALAYLWAVGWLPLAGAGAALVTACLAPCKLCLWQRYPHGLAIGVGALAYLWAVGWLPLAGAGAALVTACLGIYHAGIERGVFGARQLHIRACRRNDGARADGSDIGRAAGSLRRGCLATCRRQHGRLECHPVIWACRYLGFGLAA